MRKPRFKDYFKEAESTNPGLSDYLSGNASIDEVIMQTEYNNLDLVLSGTIPPNPSELLLTEYTQKLFDELSKRYDHIIIDSPPIGLVSDALELQKFADITAFVVRENYSLKSFIKDIDERYKKGEMNNLAIIYNDFKVNAIKQYGYGQKYGYGYGYGYGAYFEGKKKSKKWWQIYKK
jgi:capsular exopolysaccharide synthesis family protein